MHAEERLERRTNSEGLDAGKQKNQCNPNDAKEMSSKLTKPGLSEESKGKDAKGLASTVGRGTPLWTNVMRHGERKRENKKFLDYIRRG